MIPLVLIADRNFLFQTAVAISEIFRNKRQQTQYYIYIILVDCHQEDELYFQRLKLHDSKIKFIYTSTDKYKEIKQIAHISKAGLIKFDIGDLIDEQEKIIYLDADVVVRSDLSELYSFDIKDNIIGGVKSLDMLFDQTPMINSGVMLLDLKRLREGGYSSKLKEIRTSLGDRKSMDQQSINIVFKNKISFLPVKYNCIAEKLMGSEQKDYPLSKLNQLYGTNYLSKKEMIKDAIIIHYATSRKPWHYSFVQCGNEWYKAYKNSPYCDQEIHRKNRIQALFSGGINTFKQKGVKGIWQRMYSLAMQRLQGQKYEKWG